MTISTNCTGRTVVAINREEALANYYAAERRAGADPLLANERMHFFAKRLDAIKIVSEVELDITLHHIAEEMSHG